MTGTSAALLENALLTPSDVAIYDTDPETAAQHLRLDAGDLVELAGRGLPHERGGGGEPLFDYTDLTNLALERGHGQTVPELARRFLMRFAGSPAETWFEPRTWRVAVRPPALNRGGNGEPVEMLIAAPDGEADGVEVLEFDGDEGDRGGGYTAVVRLSGERDEPTSEAVGAIYDEVADALISGTVRYQNVAPLLRRDPNRAWDAGVADCEVASRLIAERLTAAGHEARVRRGFLLGLMGSDHTWCEVHEDGRWKTLDPVFAFLGHRDGAVDFAAACRGSRFNRLLPCRVKQGEPILTRGDGSLAPLWYFAAVSARPLEGGS